MNRREKIEAMLKEDPTDMFLRYSLAMELRTEGDHASSLAQLDELMKEKPACVPAFFMAGQQLVDLDRIDEARTILRNGIEEARNQGDSHAAAEMSDFLTSLDKITPLVSLLSCNISISTKSPTITSFIPIHGISFLSVRTKQLFE